MALLSLFSRRLPCRPGSPKPRRGLKVEAMSVVSAATSLIAFGAMPDMQRLAHARTGLLDIALPHDHHCEVDIPVVETLGSLGASIIFLHCSFPPTRKI